MKYLGVDFGLKRTGLAISEGEIASPLKIIESKNFFDLVEQVRKEIEANNIDLVVVGKPDGRMGKLAERFAKALRKKVTVVLADETLSSQYAQKLMVEGGVAKKRRRLSDAQAASLILQNYLDLL
ncbi:Holliday junction resolvase RuvX [Candidatus Daviesbacteria bacterium]|nr:Holliday junction resolvase RuvX [Candidatus Daviesbacteria bacterium]